MLRCNDSRLSPMPWLAVGVAFLASGSPDSGLQATGLAFLGVGLAALLRRGRSGGH